MNKVEEIEQTLKDTHVTVIQPDKECKPIYQDCHIVAESAHNLALELCQLFTQPLDEGLKVLVDGEWVEASKELKETARSIERALPDKKLREKLMVEAKDTVIPVEERIKMGVWHGRERQAQAQAEISFKAGYNKALALLQPKIEEERQICEDLIKEHRREYEAKLTLAKDIARRQERERIIEEVEQVVRRAQTRWDKAQFGAVLLDLLQALKEGGQG